MAPAKARNTSSVAGLLVGEGVAVVALISVPPADVALEAVALEVVLLRTAIEMFRPVVLSISRISTAVFSSLPVMMSL